MRTASPAVFMLITWCDVRPLHLADVGSVLIKQFGSIVLAIVVAISTGIAGLLILGVAVRLVMGVFLRAAIDSVLAVGILHQIFDASNNSGAVIDYMLDGVDAGNMTQLATVVLTALVAARLLWRPWGIREAPRRSRPSSQRTFR